jgi:hypothetical protein
MQNFVGKIMNKQLNSLFRHFVKSNELKTHFQPTAHTSIPVVYTSPHLATGGMSEFFLSNVP